MKQLGREGGEADWERNWDQCNKTERWMAHERRRRTGKTVLKQRLWGRQDCKLHCSPLRHLRNNLAYKAPINELSTGPVLKDFIWLWGSFVYSHFPSVSTSCEFGHTVTLITSRCVIFWTALPSVGIPLVLQIRIRYLFITLSSSFILLESRCVFVLQRRASGNLCWGSAEDRQTSWGQNRRTNPVSSYGG